MTARQTLIGELEKVTGRKADDLMNALQDRGAISDNAVNLSDVPDSELNRALRTLQRPRSVVGRGE